MPTPIENILRLMRNKDPVWLGDPWDCFITGSKGPIMFDAVTLASERPKRGEGMRRDIWGIMWDWPDSQPRAVPYRDGKHKVLRDIYAWREILNFDNLPAELPWELTRKINPPFDQGDKLLMVPSYMGMFEFSTLILGFEDAMVNYMTEQDEMYAMLSAYTDWKIKAVEMVIDEMQPDVIHSQDDWRDKRRLFLPPTVWREIIKPHYERYYRYIKKPRGTYTASQRQREP